MPNDPDSQDRPATLNDLATTIAAAEQRIIERLTESMRDMQTEILTGLERFARGNFSRMHTIEARVQTTDTNVTDNNARLAALEERVLYLETRRPPQ